MPRPALPREERTCPVCSNTFTVRADLPQLCCSRTCARRRDNKLRPKSKPRICPCGKEIEAPDYHQSRYAHNRKYCSVECRDKYGLKRQKDPSKWVTFNCLNCGKQVEARKSLNFHKYCSNSCAQKHTRKKQHIVVDDAVVLDSGYEALFWGLCAFLKIPVERFDREQSIRLPSGHHYGPDFYLPQQGLYVETKGFEDGDDRARYAAWQVHHTLVVLDRTKLQMLRSTSREDFLDRMAKWSLISL